MARQKNEFASRIDPVIQKVVDAYPTYFTKRETIQDVCKASPHLSNMLNGISQQYRGWGLQGVILHAVEDRLTEYLQQKTPSKYGVKLRKFENYAVGNGPRRWQKLEAMSLSELKVCVNYRRAHVKGEQAVIEAYEKIIEEMRKLQKAKVGDVLLLAQMG